MEARLGTLTRIKPLDSVVLLAVGALKSIGSGVHPSTREFRRVSKQTGTQFTNSTVNMPLGIPIPALVIKRQERDLYPDTGESGETYDMEAFAQFHRNRLR